MACTHPGLKDLSIQVHPDDAYAGRYENGALGKTECWYVLDCDEDATIVIGHHAGSREELRSMIEEGRWKELIREVPVRKGDFFQINPGLSCFSISFPFTVPFHTVYLEHSTSSSNHALALPPPCFSPVTAATGLALAVALSTSGTGLYGGIPQVSAAIWQAASVMSISPSKKVPTTSINREWNISISFVTSNSTVVVHVPSS